MKKLKNLIILFLTFSPFCVYALDDQVPEINKTSMPKFISKEIDVKDFPTITIKYGKDSKTLECSLDKKAKTYICQNGSEPLLVINNVFGFKALKNNKNNLPEVVQLTSVNSGDELLMLNPFHQMDSGYVGAKAFVRSKDLGSEFREKIESVEQFFNLGPTLPNRPRDKRIIGSPAYEEIATKIISTIADLRKEMSPIYHQRDYQLELASGQKINCQRGESRKLSSEEIKYQKSMKTDIQCGSFQCESLVINGKKYDPTLFYQSEPGGMVLPTLHLIDEENNLGPTVLIRKVISNKINIPVVDNSSYIDHSSDSQSPFEAAMTFGIPQTFANRDKVALYRDASFVQFINHQSDICKSGNLGIKKLELAQKNLAENLAKLELVEFIQVLADGSLIGNYIDPNRAAEMGCLYEGIILDSLAATHLDKIKKNIRPDQQIDQAISKERATELFNKAKAMTDIAWDYKTDGCYARAHLMARRFEAEGVRVDKVWIKGNLTVPNTYPLLNFRLHVAPIVYVNDENGLIKKMVIDPSLFDKPVSVEEWDNRMTKNTVRGSSLSIFPFPENATILERAVIAFSSSDPYLPKDSIHLTEEQKINSAKEVMERYLKASKK